MVVVDIITTLSMRCAFCPKILGQSYSRCYYAPDARRACVGLKMVLMVIFLSCAGVSVHLKNPDFSYFVAYIAHSRLSVIGYIYRVKREKSARISARIR